MKLSIGMIIKNEEEHLERCLTGIKPILENVDSELIIADTGSTDNSVEIAKRFTENVFHFEWINDFAAARNSTLQRARGEWYMFVDGDEVFKSCDNIIKFFNSGEYKKFNSASFVIRNLLSSLGDNTNIHYDDFNAPRLTRILPYTQFSGEIHESLNTYSPPIKKLNDIAEHYGYLYKNDEELQAKMKRNIDLLHNELENAGNKDTSKIYLQLFESYSNIDKDKAYEYLEKGIETAKCNKSKFLVALYCDKAGEMFAKNKYEQAIESCNEYFKIDKDIRPGPLTSDAEVYAIKASSEYNLMDYNAAIEDYINFFKTFKLIKSDKLNTFDAYMITYSIAIDRNFIPILNEFVYCCRHAGKYNLAADYLQSMPIYRYSVVDNHVSVIVSQIIHVLEHFDYKNVNQYYKQLNGFGKQKLKEFLCLDLFKTEKKKDIISALYDISKTDDEFREKTKILDLFFDEKTVPKEELYSFAGKYCINDNPEIMFVALQQGNDLTEMFKSPSFDMKLTVYNGYMTVYGFAKAVENYTADSIVKTESIPEAAKFYEYSMKTLPFYRSPRPESVEILSFGRLFDTFAALGKRYTEESGVGFEEMSQEMKSAVIACEIVEARIDKRYKDCFAAMKKAVLVYQGIAAVIDEYQRSVLAEYEASVKPDPANEMQRLAIMVKSNIRNYIALGNIEAARKTLSDYCMIAPDDPETEELEKLITSN